MNTKSLLSSFAAALLALANTATSHAQGTAFTYQGRLNLNGSVASGSYDMAFSLYNTNVNGSAFAGPVTNTAVSVTNGLFTTTVDFGNVYDGASNWLQIAVSTNGANAFNPLTPRQRLTPVPYALYSASAMLASGVVAGSITAADLAPGAASVLGTPNGSDTNAVVVSNSGLVGIGTSSPVAGLDVTTGADELTLPVLFEAQNGSYGYTNFSSSTGVPAVNNNLLAISSGSGVTLINFANPAAPQVVGQTSGNGIFTNFSGCFGLAWAGSNLVVGSQGDNAFTIISCTNPANPVAISQAVNGVGGWNYLNTPYFLCVSGNTLAVAAYGSSAVNLVDISNPSSPVLKSTLLNGSFGFTNLGSANSVAISGNLLAIGAIGSNAVTLVNVANPADPQQFSEIRNGFGGFTNLNGLFSVALSGNLLAISAAYSSAVTLVDVSNPSNPIKLAELLDGVGGYALTEAASLSLSGNRLVIGSLLNSTITLVDVSNPSSPVLLATAKNGFNGANYLSQPYALTLYSNNIIECGSTAGAYTVFGMSTQTVSVASSGWLGIGTSQPGAPLDVVGNVMVENANFFDVNANQVELGLDAIAGGYQAMALGTYASASGTNSLAMGLQATASGDTSLALGAYTTASADQSVAIGKNALASGEQACAVGVFSTANTNNACAFGEAYAYGISSFAGGNDAYAEAPFSLALGYNVTANAPNSMALGYNALALGTNSTAVGNGARAYGNASTALGYGVTASGSNSWAAGYNANATSNGAVVLADGSTGYYFYSTNNNEFAVRAVGGVRLVTAVDGSGNPTAGAKLYPGGTSWATISDQNAKKNFTPVNGEEVLARLASVPVEKWNYKWESDSSTPNIGPMAQAFKAAFYPGRDDKAITTLEFDGVELAAIQGLNQKLENGSKDSAARLQNLEAENAALKTQNDALADRLNQLETLVKQIAAQK